ncbi:TetR family transcriptional regulator [Xanthomonadaceae bacterium JHOS43]|nr:TetR family transcriptional regulator [Xanthomonadaceae bacterium JHOS43]MCX7563486.1 TetR family transcriptional regulator [Xanthomonadaceae bacterium XH05]
MPAAATPHFSTKERILSVAEALFAEHGFAGTSLRLVTSQADVNLAAVNYHFGSKDNLVAEVFRRRMDEMSRARLELLESARLVEGDRLDAVLRAFIEPALALSLDRDGGAAFVRVLARAYAERNDRLRKFLSDNYGHVLREFSRAIAECMPQLSKEALYWRLDFLAGALTYAMADFGLLRRGDNTDEKSHCERAASELVAFAAAGFRAG